MIPIIFYEMDAQVQQILPESRHLSILNDSTLAGQTGWLLALAKRLGGC